ncbi:MAG TPA: hypothetical protein VI935_08715 [Thermodesulfobacteriota bacterium]|nr:hypothetical protein [Thermodesulfobacteriota bacterium]
MGTSKIKVRVPPYRPPRYEWRKVIHQTVVRELKNGDLAYLPSDRLEINVRLYLDKKSILHHDVDNRLKDMLDALQGRAGGSKKVHKLKPIIPNDNQVYKVSIEKVLPPPQSHGLGHLVIKRYKQK